MKLETTNEIDPSTPREPKPLAPSATPGTPHFVGPMPPEVFISRHELARRLKKCLRTISYWQRRGILPYVKCGRSVYFKWTDVEAHLQKNFRACILNQSTQNQPSADSKTRRRRNKNNQSHDSSPLQNLPPA